MTEILKVVLDADGLIKLTKCGILPDLLEACNCVIPRQVYTETVVEGIKQLYEDAFEIGEYVEEGRLAVKSIKISFEEETLGSGELSAFALFKQSNYHFIVSDDQAFLKFLRRKSIPFLIPSDVIVLLFNMKQINKCQAKQYLNQLKPLTRDEAYYEALEQIKEVEE